MSHEQEVESSTDASATTHAKELDESRNNTFGIDYPDEWYPKAIVRPEATIDELQLDGNISGEVSEEDEELVEKCIEIMRQENKASTSVFQRRLRLGYTRAARIIDILEQRGYIASGEGARPREILNLEEILNPDPAPILRTPPPLTTAL